MHPQPQHESLPTKSQLAGFLAQRQGPRVIATGTSFSALLACPDLLAKPPVLVQSAVQTAYL